MANRTHTVAALLITSVLCSLGCNPAWRGPRNQVASGRLVGDAVVSVADPVDPKPVRLAAVDTTRRSREGAEAAEIAPVSAEQVVAAKPWRIPVTEQAAEPAWDRQANTSGAAASVPKRLPATGSNAVSKILKPRFQRFWISTPAPASSWLSSPAD